MNVRELREKTGMNRVEFADYLHIPYRTVQKWELTGKEYRPCTSYLLELMEYKLRHEGKIKGE